MIGAITSPVFRDWTEKPIFHASRPRTSGEHYCGQIEIEASVFMFVVKTFHKMFCDQLSTFQTDHKSTIKNPKGRCGMDDTENSNKHSATKFCNGFGCFGTAPSENRRQVASATITQFYRRSETIQLHLQTYPSQSNGQAGRLINTFNRPPGNAKEKRTTENIFAELSCHAKAVLSRQCVVSGITYMGDRVLFLT